MKTKDRRGSGAGTVQPPSFTARQGQHLAFIQRFTARYGVAPSFEEIAAHFGVSSPSVNGMIRTLERRGLLSRLPGVARSLRVLVPASSLPGSDYGARAGGGGRGVNPAADTPSLQDVAVAAALAVLDALQPRLSELPAEAEISVAVAEAASAVRMSLEKAGMSPDEAEEAARRVAAEAARWTRDGRGIVLRRRQWRR